MKILFILVSLVISAPGFAEEVGTSCLDLSVTGIHSKEEFSKFFAKLNAAAASKDKVALSKAVLFPLEVHSTPKRKAI